MSYCEKPIIRHKWLASEKRRNLSALVEGIREASHEGNRSVWQLGREICWSQGSEKRYEYLPRRSFLITLLLHNRSP